MDRSSSGAIVIAIYVASRPNLQLGVAHAAWLPWAACRPPSSQNEIHDVVHTRSLLYASEYGRPISAHELCVSVHYFQ